MLHCKCPGWVWASLGAVGLQAAVAVAVNYLSRVSMCFLSSDSEASYINTCCLEAGDCAGKVLVRASALYCRVNPANQATSRHMNTAWD